MERTDRNAAVYAFGEFRLDGFLLEWRGERVPLSPKALDTLAALVECAGKVVDKETLMQRIWPDTYVAESGLARNISVLRKTLADYGGSEPYIETIAKKGYRFVAPVRRAGDRPPSEPQSTEPQSTEPQATEPQATEPQATEPPAPVARPRRLAAIPAWTVAAVAVALVAVAGGLAWRSSRPPVAPAAVMSAPYRIGLYLLEKRTPMEAERALQSFRRAVELEPQSAEPYAALTNVYLAALQLGVAEKYVGELANGASEAAGRAIALDPASPHALAAQGAVLMFLHWSFLDAEAALERALAIDPEHEMSLYYSSRLRLLRRDFDDAIALARRAQRVNPVSPLFEVQEALVHYVQRDFGKTVEILHRVLDRERNDTIAHYYLALSYGFLENFHQAEQHLSRAELLAEVIATDRAWLALRRGDRGPAESRLRELEQRVEAGLAAPDSLILLASELDEIDDGLQALAAAIRARRMTALEARVDPRLERLRQDSRYEAMMREGGLAP